jgi:biopolymer transport protein ExbD
MALRLDPDDELVEAHEINVTPFIDVMLVLLIIFMVTAPLATVDVRVDLPVSTAHQQPQPQRPVYLTLEADGSLLLGDRAVTRAGLAAALDEATGNTPDTRIFLRADKRVAYGDLMTVMNALRGAGYLKIALVGLDTGATP